MYLLDSNVFIEAHQRYYGLDFAPGFWDWLLHSRQSGVLASIDSIKAELEQREDELADWSKANVDFFLETDAVVQSSFQILSEWTMSKSLPYRNAARFDFMASGDYRLIAYAHAHKHVVITHEQSAPDSKKRIKIPDACRALGVECRDVFPVIRETGTHFLLA